MKKMRKKLEGISILITKIEILILKIVTVIEALVLILGIIYGYSDHTLQLICIILLNTVIISLLELDWEGDVYENINKMVINNTFNFKYDV